MNILVGFIGVCALALLIYYVVILMKGDEAKVSSVIQYILYLAVLSRSGDSAWRVYQTGDERRKNVSFQNFDAL